MLDEFVHEPRVAYFSMEIALRSEIPTYAGGLGVLAGDTLRSAADLNLALVGVTLVSRNGYFRQEITAEGRQAEHPAPWDPRTSAQTLDARIALKIENRTVWIGAWLHVISSAFGGSIPVLLLDTDLPENDTQDREITQVLYGNGASYRLKQEMVLGIGGVKMLMALGFDVQAYHLNEGHSALLGLELLRRYEYRRQDVRAGESPYDVPRVRHLCRFTTHTPVEAGHDRFQYDLVAQLFGTDPDGIEMSMVKRLAGPDVLNMTRLALELSETVNGVAKRHAEVSAAMFPGFEVRAITNGVHPYTWTSKAFAILYDHYIPGWRKEPELLIRVHSIPDSAILDAHARSKLTLIERVHALTQVELHPHVPILAFARRMTAYKRPDLLFEDLERLRAIASERSFSVILAGKAHPHDEDGKRLIETVLRHGKALADAVKVVFLPDYDLALAQLLVAGADIWLNTPLPPLEASGTSGMKAAFNGVPSLSVLDGWWLEGCLEGVTGWGISSASDLYEKLEHTVLPLYYGYGVPDNAWVSIMKNAIGINAAYFNSHRMMRRYATECYLS